MASQLNHRSPHWNSLDPRTCGAVWLAPNAVALRSTHNVQASIRQAPFRRTERHIEKSPAAAGPRASIDENAATFRRPGKDSTAPGAQLSEIPLARRG